MSTATKILSQEREKVADKKEVFSLLRQHQTQITEWGVSKIGLFGSFIRGEQTDRSDVDILVQFEKGKKTFKNFMRLAYFLEELFNRKTEVVTIESLSPFLKPHILKEVKYVSFPD